LPVWGQGLYMLGIGNNKRLHKITTSNISKSFKAKLTPEYQALGGILVKRECWTLALRGRIIFLFIAVCAMYVFINGLFPFLALNGPTFGDVMIIEGWVHSDTLQQAANVYLTKRYKEVLVVNGVLATGSKWDSGQYKLDYIKDSLINLGVPKEHIHPVVCEVTRKDRTYFSALAAKNWLEQHEMHAKSIDVATIGPHARRSRLVFQKAFGREAVVGVIALTVNNFDPDHWWQSSEGVREVLFEGFAYLYARFFFYP
jgi:hypothetical protein